jgi:hypothetical protein
MADIAWADVIARYPGDAALAAVDPGAGDSWAKLANGLSAKFFGGDDSEKYKTARILYAAHFALGGGGGGGAAAAGPVTSESEGGVTRSYAVTSTAAISGSHASTSYGRLYDELVRSSPYRILGGCT